MATAEAAKAIHTFEETKGNYKRVDVPEPMSHRIAQWAKEGYYIGLSEEYSPYIPFGDNAAIRHLAFDVRNNIYCNILWIKGPGAINTHKHRGMVWAVGLEGTFRYLEYDWVAGPGDFIQETPGEAHTLVTDHEQGVKLFGWMQGPIDFYNDKGEFVQALDVWWYIHHYETYCKENGLEINPQLYL